MLLQAILLFLVTAVAVCDEATIQFGFFRPVFIGAATGAVMGNVITGIIIGAALELIFASGQIGAYIPPDAITGTVIGTAVGILTGTDAASAVLVGLPVAILGQQLKVLAYTINISLVHRAEKAADNADLSKIGVYHFSGLIVQSLVMGLPVFFAVLFGIEHAVTLVELLPEWLMNGLMVASKILPALGMGMLLSMMLNKRTWAFMIAGFIAVAYFSLPTIGCALLGLVMAVVCDMVMNEGKKNQPAVAAVPASAAEEEVDL